MASDAETARVFFAVVPGASAREQMRHAAERLPVAAPGRRVPPVNYHATLAFIGEASATQIASLCEIGGALRAERCTLCFDEWAHWRTARVIVAVAGTVPSELQSLQRQLRRALEWHGWAADPRPFRPHVTLARKVTQAPVLPALSSVEWSVDAVCLMRSKIAAGQSAYTVVGTWPLLYDASKT